MYQRNGTRQWIQEMEMDPTDHLSKKWMVISQSKMKHQRMVIF
jgi:hypothetical protein